MREGKRQRQLVIARALATRHPGVTQKQIAEENGVSLPTISLYLKEPEFREMVRRFTDDALVTYIPQIDRAMVDKACTGNVAAATYIAKRAGRLTDVTQDKSFTDFVKRLETADVDSVQFYMEHGRWPDQDAAEMMPEPPGEQ